jgi:ferredoxin
MKSLRYIDGVTSINLDQQKCIGCGMCTQVCPHGVITLTNKKAQVIDRDGCMECGACAMNCPTDAISVSPGVGCASLIIRRWLRGKNIPAGDCC